MRPPFFWPSQSAEPSTATMMRVMMMAVSIVSSCHWRDGSLLSRHPFNDGGSGACVRWRTHDEVEVRDHDIMDASDYRGHAGFGRWLEDWDAAGRTPRWSRRSSSMPVITWSR